MSDGISHCHNYEPHPGHHWGGPTMTLYWCVGCVDYSGPCPNDTDGDGNCGQRYCPWCGEGRRPRDHRIIDAAYEMNLHFSQTNIDYDAIIARAETL